MCSVVGISGINFNNFDFTDDNWYQKFQWSARQEQEFIKWMQDYLYKNSEARKELMTYPKKSRKDIEKVVDGFILNYGWKTKQTYETDEI